MIMFIYLFIFCTIYKSFQVEINTLKWPNDQNYKTEKLHLI